MFGLADVDLDVESEGNVVEDVLSETGERVVLQVLEQFAFLGQVPVALEVVHELLRVRVRVRVYQRAQLVELQAV